MRLDEVLDRNPVIVDPDEKIVEAARAMRVRRASSALVARDGRLIGILTERDLASKIVAQGISLDGAFVGDFMTPNPVTAPPGLGTWEALSLMTVKGIRHLPVCEGSTPLGVVSVDDLASGAGAGRLLDGFDEAQRARVAEILLWCAEQIGLRRERFPVPAGLD